MTAGTAGEIVATGATVEGIDHSTGVLTLRAADGEQLELKQPRRGSRACRQGIACR
jgi:hypothetical protein